MFRLKESGLPKDPVFPSDLKGLGYFINEDDEVRSIANPNAYFNYFLTKNDRVNNLQREAMNSALREIILERLLKLNLSILRLPLDTKPTQPHIPILISNNIKQKTRIILLFYEHNQDLGVFAHRIIGSRGGINKGSAVDFVKHIHSLPDAPGIVIANMGQLRWYRRGGHACTQTTWYALPQRSAASGPLFFDVERNTVEGNRSTAEHVQQIFRRVLPKILNLDAKLDVIGVSEGAVKVVEYLNSVRGWNQWGPRIEAVALLAPFHCLDDISNREFAECLRKRGRAYTTSTQPANTPLAGPNGGHCIPGHGCPTYSLGEPYYSEMMLPKGYMHVIDWFQEVSQTPGYVNAEVVVEEYDNDEHEDGGHVLQAENKNDNNEGADDDVCGGKENLASKIEVMRLDLAARLAEKRIVDESVGEGQAAVDEQLEGTIVGKRTTGGNDD